MNMEQETKGDAEHRPFLDYKDFPDLVRIQDQYEIILDELKYNKLWLNWGSDAMDPSGHCMFLKGNWNVCPVYFGRYAGLSMQLGELSFDEAEKIIDSLPSRFPKTIALLKSFPKLNFAAFSRLHPKSVLAPHTHSNPFSWISHLGLIIPSNASCGLKVEDQTFLWRKPGDMLVFDDNLEHSAWNHSDEERVVLYIDFQR